MENPAFSQDSLNTLRLRDTAKVWTNYLGQPTPPPIVMDIFVQLLEIVDNHTAFGCIKFQLRTLYFGHLVTSDLTDISDIYLYKLGITCLYYILEANHNYQALNILHQLLQGTDFEGFFMTIEHAEILIQLSMNGGITEDLTTPYDYANVMIKHGYRKTVKKVIDLSLTFIKVCNMTAEEVFLACCIFINDMKFHEEVSQWMQNHFNHALWGALEHKVELKHEFQAVNNGIN